MDEHWTNGPKTVNMRVRTRVDLTSVRASGEYTQQRDDGRIVRQRLQWVLLGEIYNSRIMFIRRPCPTEDN